MAPRYRTLGYLLLPRYPCCLELPTPQCPCSCELMSASGTKALEQSSDRLGAPQPLASDTACQWRLGAPRLRMGTPPFPKNQPVLVSLKGSCLQRQPHVRVTRKLPLCLLNPPMGRFCSSCSGWIGHLSRQTGKGLWRLRGPVCAGVRHRPHLRWILS